MIPSPTYDSLEEKELVEILRSIVRVNDGGDSGDLLHP
jgi:hypothetical protein